jgi:cell division protein ZapA
MPSVNVSINGKNYRMACDEGQEEHLEMLASELDSAVNNLKGSFGEIGDQRLTVMAGIMMTDEMLMLKKKTEMLEAEIANLRETGALQSREKQTGDDELASNIETVAKKIELIAGKMSGV